MDTSTIRDVRCKNCDSLIGVSWPEKVSDDGGNSSSSSTSSRYKTKGLPKKCTDCDAAIDEDAINKELPEFNGDGAGFWDEERGETLGVDDVQETAAEDSSAIDVHDPFADFPADWNPYAGFEFDSEITPAWAKYREVKDPFKNNDFQVSGTRLSGAHEFPTPPFEDVGGIGYEEDLQMFPPSSYGCQTINDPNVPDLPSVGPTPLSACFDAAELASPTLTRLEGGQTIFPPTPEPSSETPPSSAAFCSDAVATDARSALHQQLQQQFQQQRERPTIPYADLLPERCLPLPEVKKEDVTTMDTDTAAANLLALCRRAVLEDEQRTVEAASPGTPSPGNTANENHSGGSQGETTRQSQETETTVKEEVSATSTDIANVREHTHTASASASARPESPADEIMKDASRTQTPHPTAAEATAIIPEQNTTNPESKAQAVEEEEEAEHPEAPPPVTPCPDSPAESMSQTSYVSATEDVGTPSSTCSRGSRGSLGSRGRRRRGSRLTVRKYAWRKGSRRTATPEEGE